MPRVVAFLLAALSLAPVACVEPVPPDDPVPPFVLPKETFSAEHEWWLARTVTDLPYQAAFTYVGDGDYPDRVRWRITESYLIAYRSRPQLVGITPDTADAADYEAPALMYPIRRHLDVIEGQLIEAPKRPWYERAYIEVDWANEASGSYRFGLTRMDTAPRSPPAYIVDDPADVEAAPVFTPEYIDFTTHVTVQPTAGEDIFEQREICDIPVASEIVDLIDCSPLDIAFRTSLRRIPADYDYEPLAVSAGEEGTNATWSQRFFSMGRIIVDDEYGMVDDGLHFLVSRANLWRRSFDDEGRRIPLHEREVKPRAYHVGPDFPADMLVELEDALAQWNEVMRGTLVDARRFECLEQGGAAGACDDAAADVPEDVLVLCPNWPVAKGDPPACGEPGTKARHGDLRFNFVKWETAPHIQWSLGIGWWVPDPATGEGVSSWMIITPAGINRAAAIYRDLVLMAQGRLEAKDFVDAAHFAEWLEDVRDYSLNPYAAFLETPTPPETPRPGASTGLVPTPSPIGERPLPATTLPPPARPDPEPMPMTYPMVRTFEEAVAPIVGTELEMLTIDKEALLLAGIDPEEPHLPDDVIERASPLRRPYHLPDTPKRRARERMERFGIDFELPADIDIHEYVSEWTDASPDEIYKDIRRRYAHWVFLHELGHILGLTHNFAASYDAMNFRPEYWALRDDGNLGPRYLDPMTQAEQDGLIENHAYASVMDYFPAPTSIAASLGYYDQAAIRWAYGDMVEVFSELDDEGLRHMEAEWRKSNILGMIMHIEGDTAEDHVHTGLHYSKLQRVLGDLSRREWVRTGELVDTYGWGKAVTDGAGRVVVPYMYCQDGTVGARNWCHRYDRGADAYEVITSTINKFRVDYPVASFRRARVNFRVDDYVLGVWYQTFEHLRNYLGHYVHKSFEFTPAERSDPDFLGPNREGVEEAFRFLGALLTTPQPGDHYLVTRPDGLEVLRAINADYAELNPNNETIHHGGHEPLPEDPPLVTIPIGEGRYFKSNTIVVGGSFNVNNVGASVDKQLAIEALLTPEFWQFAGRDSWENTRYWTVNFTRAFPDETLDLIGSIVANDIERIAPRFDGTRVVARDFMNLDETPTGIMVDPMVGLTVRVRMLVTGLGLHFRRSPDRGLLDLARIVLVGSGEDFTTTRTPVDFTHPYSGEVLRAYRYDESGRELGIGARLLDRAILLDAIRQGLNGETPDQQEAAAEMLQDDLDMIDIVRAIVKRYDEEAFTPDPPDPSLDEN